MTTTRVNFDLSPGLLTSQQLLQPGVYAYAFAFGTVGSNQGQLVSQTTLVNNGSTSGTQSFIDLTNGLTNGAIYVVIQQGGDGTLPSGITGIGDITLGNSASKNYSYQLFEVSLDGGATDLGDISALNTFGFGASMEVVFSDNTTQSRGFRGSANTIFSAVGSSAVEPYNPNGFGTPNNRLGIGPASITGDFPSSDWTAYINSLAANPAILDDIVLVSTFTGTAFQPTPMLSVYSVEYSEADQSFWLVPDLTHGGTNTDWMKIPKTVLAENIYVQPTNIEIHQGSKTGPILVLPVTYESKSTGGFTPNIADGGVSKYFVAGFDAGYWGGSGTSPNPLVATPINLNHSTNWNVNYAYNGSLNPGLVTVSNPLSGNTYDKWAQAIQSNANAYGWSYSDLVSAGGVNPQLTMWDPTVGPIDPNTGKPVGANVGTINIGLFANSEVPGSFQEAPTTYVAHTGSGYLPSLTLPTYSPPIGYGSQIGFNFNFGVGALNFAPYLDTEIWFKFYVGDNSGLPQAVNGFVPLQVTAPNGDWYNYTVQFDTATSTWSLAPGAQHTTAGSFSLFNLPVTADGSPSWYQLEFGAPGSQTIYNLYATSNTTPDGQGINHGITDLVIDRAVEVGVTAASVSGNTPAQYSLNFAPGGSLTYDIGNIPARALHDINADGYSDLVFQNTDGTVFGWEQNAGGTIAAAQIGSPDPTWQAKAVADFYGDGGADILFQNSTTSQVFIWKQDGFSIATAGAIGTPGLEWQVQGAGDINGDGAADIIFQNSTTGDVFGWLQHGLSTNVGGAATIGTPGTAWQVKGIANFFGGANACDIVLQNTATGDVNIWQMNGLTVVNNKTVGSPGAAWQIKATGDVNGDGYADLIFQNSGSGDVAVWQQNGYSTILAGTIGAPGTAWQVAGTGDFNGDGKADLVFRNSTTGQVYEWQMNGQIQETGLDISLAISLGDPGTAWHII